jgi:ABC-2 type transport system ATP-binding protein
MTTASPTTGPVVAARGLTRWFGEDRAVDGVDLTVASGEIHALVGLNSAGKTTLMKLLLGMLRPDAGGARLFGEPVGDRTAGVVAGRHLLETPFAYGELTPTENVIAAARLHGMDVSAARLQAAEMIGELTLDRWADRRSRVLSLGDRAPRTGLRAGSSAAAADSGRTDQWP